jgi:ribokinase
MKPRIVVLGSSNTDMVVRLNRLPRPGETLLGGEFSLAAGGKGANQAVAAARAGGSVDFVARIGQDMFGDQALAGFRQDGIHVQMVIRDREAPSGVALIFVGKHGENSIAVAGGANTKLSPRDVTRARTALTTASSLVMQLETPLPTVITAARTAHELGTRIILNPAPAAQLPAKLLRLVSILTPNEVEAEMLTGIRVTNDQSAERAARGLLAQKVGTVIVTLGARGAFVLSRNICSRVKGFRVKPVDTVAAGDVFNGALAVALGEGQGLLDAVRFANAAAALSVTRHGAQPSAPQRRDIDALLKG